MEENKNIDIDKDIHPEQILTMISGIIPNTKYFDGRFDLLQVQIDEIRRNQEIDRNQLRDFKLDVDRRFNETSSKFDQINKGIDDFKYSIDKRFEQVDKRIDDFKSNVDDRFRQVDKRFEQVDRRFDQVDDRFEQVDKRFEQVDKRFEQVDRRFDQVDDRFEQVDKRFDQVDKRFEQMIASIDKLSDKLEFRDRDQRSFTLKMFTIAIMVSVLGVLGAFFKILGIF
ncbi:MAG: hypothetical protein M1276_08425 [Deltaproteobacteria bacterium]|nr:hypothetical protein [Deltaproteobacteria bacterium]